MAERTTPVSAGEPDAGRAREAPSVRLRAMVDAHYAFIWRQIRRLGLSADRAEDAAQQVFLVASKRLDEIDPGTERAFLFGVARRVASDVRRSAAFRRERLGHDDQPPDVVDTAPHPDEALDRTRARALLDEVLGAMEDDLRTVFALFELEEMKTAEVAELLGIPLGTASSRIRRAREQFQEIMKRIKARDAFQGARP